jgi:hypothetical protein
VRRPVCREANAALRDRFELVRWLRAETRRQQRYLGLCEHLWTWLAETGDGDEPAEDDILGMLAKGLRADSSYWQYVYRRRATVLTEDDVWEKVYRAGAAALLDEYLDVVDRRSANV